MTKRPELLQATDADIDDALAFADPMVLRGLLYQLTGDEAIPATEVIALATGGLGGQVMGVGNPDDVALIRSKAADFLKQYRDSGAGDLPIGPADRLHRSLTLSAGADVPAAELEMWLEELALDPWARGHVWQQEPPAERLENFSVLVIGAGMGGLNSAVQLQHAGVDFTVVEKNSGVGGTWYENRYPGARVDSPSRNYTHAFGVDFPYPNPFCGQAENEKYFNWIADHFDLRKNIEFNTEVKSVIWDEQAKLWEIKAEQQGGTKVWRANAIISCVGFLARPNMPNIDGMSEFQGTSFHTARWPSGVDFEDKRVAVIGSGCTGYQLVPELAKMASHTYAFQRTPSWVFDVPGYLDPFPPQVNWLDRNFPYLTNFVRFRTGWGSRPDVTMKIFGIDPTFSDPHATSAVNKVVRDQRIEFMRTKFADHPELVETMLPVAPPMSSRPVLVDRNYSIYDAILRDDVTLVTDGIERITPNGIKVRGGEEHALDVIVFATGFKANEFLWPMEIIGRNGQRIEELWAKDGARAYMGTMLPGFPNFFMIYGPNTNPIGGLQVVDMEEMVTRFALECIGHLIEQNLDTVDVTVDAYWRYNDELDRAEELKNYHDPRAHNYYQNEFGRSAANMPFDARLSWEMLRSPFGPRSADGDEQLAERLATVAEISRPYFGEDLVVE
ncbi:MAG: Flavin-containing monooxygenase-like protein [Frankiales bacterium]|nr:Flavin-containing monooxygenase-like protein [Frankiales bacterium]